LQFYEQRSVSKSKKKSKAYQEGKRLTDWGGRWEGKEGKAITVTVLLED